MFKNFSLSAKNLRDTRVLCASAALTAVFVVLYSLKLPLSPQLRITFTFLPVAAAGWLFGAVPAMLVGAVGDIAGSLLFPQGAYFPGFTLTKLLSGLIYGIILYRADGKSFLPKICLAQILVNFLLNTFLNALWLTVITSKGYTLYLAQHFIKNAASLPAEVILLFLVLRFLSGHKIRKMYK